MDIITVENVSKVYPLYDKTIDRLKETLSITKKSYHRDFYALNDVSFNIGAGETIGIIGTNGSGKSTILKIITGVLTPTEGNVTVNGKISALLELGAGFNMDYTGMENLYMNGTMMGYSKEEMEEKIPAILDFADIGEFVHQPVKTYSSGMFVRLAFALAINVEPEILIVDEALAVGDAFFQAKCFSKLEEIRNAGTTILFVSHDIVSVKQLCKRAIWIEKGLVRMDGDSNEVCEQYLSMQIEENNRMKSELVKGLHLENNAKTIKEKDKIVVRKLDYTSMKNVTATDAADMLSFYIRDEKGDDVNVLRPNKKYTFGIIAEFKESVENALFGFEMENAKGVKLFSINNFLSNSVMSLAEKGKIYEVKFDIRLPKVCNGEYLISPCIAAGEQNNHIVHVRLHNAIMINVDNSEGYNLSIFDLDAKTTLIERDRKSIKFYE
ncbi:MAG: ABC transporter ATP-binding protein [Lachnospiraceae bacterium]|nr:ABC transporter ATP-binding protein [Lachnospiraceae bacterium]